MRITQIQATNIEAAEAVHAFATEKIMSLERFAKRFDPCDVAVELGKTSEHHQKGDVFFAEVTISIPGDTIRARVEKDDLYAAIDELKDAIKAQLVDRKEKLIEERTAMAADLQGEEDVLPDEDDDEEENELSDDSEE